jgi:multidrug efflux pump subunit AcrB
MNFSRTFTARPIATSLLMAGILLVGAAAYPLLPVAPPQVDFPTIQVSSQLPEPAPRSCPLPSRNRWSANSVKSRASPG